MGGITRWLVVLGLVVATGSMLPAALGADRIYAALVLATSEDPARPVPEELRPFEAGLRQVFGYNSFYLLEDDKEKVREGMEEMVVSTKRLQLKLRCLEQSEAAYTVTIELFSKDKLMLTTKARLAREAPLYIRGPNWGKGRLIFVLEVR